MKPEEIIDWLVGHEHAEQERAPCSPFDIFKVLDERDLYPMPPMFTPLNAAFINEVAAVVREKLAK